MYELRLEIQWLFPKSRINNSPRLVQIMAWRRLEDNSLIETMMSYLTDAYMSHPASVN